MTLAEILMYLTGDLKVSIINDIRPCLSLGYDEGGYFAAPLLVLSYVDYLGALYHGYEGYEGYSSTLIWKSEYS